MKNRNLFGFTMSLATSLGFGPVEAWALAEPATKKDASTKDNKVIGLSARGGLHQQYQRLCHHPRGKLVADEFGLPQDHSHTGGILLVTLVEQPQPPKMDHMKNCYVRALLLVGFLIATAINGYSVTYSDSGTNVYQEHYLTVPSATMIVSSVTGSNSGGAVAIVVIQPYGTVLNISAAPNSFATQTLTNQPVGYQYIVIHAGSGGMITTITW